MILGVSAGLQVSVNARVPDLLAVPAWRRVVSYEPGLEQVDFGTLLSALDWLIIGGESGGRARRFDLTWAQRLSEACQRERVAYFFKQAGRRPFIGGAELPRLEDSHGGDLDELSDLADARALH